MKPALKDLVLLAVTAASLLFGAYGFLFGGLLLKTEPGADQHRGPTVAGNAHPARPGTGFDTERTAQPPANDPALPTEQVSATEHAAANASGSVRGSVVDRNGAAIGGASVVAIDIELLIEARLNLGASREEMLAAIDGIEQMLDQRVRRATTDASGRFVIDGLDEKARFELRASSQAHGTTSQWGVNSGDDVRLGISSDGFLIVSVVDAEGEPVKRVTVTKGSGDVRNREALRHAEGRYRVEWDSWLHWVTFTARGHLPSRRVLRSEIGAQGLQLRLERAHVLQGVISDPAGNHIPGAIVRIVSGTGPGGTAPALENLDWDPEVQADNRGRYVFSSLPAGRYLVRAGLSDPDQADSPQREVAVSGITVAHFTLDTGARATIEVRGGDSGPLDFFFASFTTRDGEDVHAKALPKTAGGQVFIGLPRKALRVHLSAFGYCPLVAELDLSSGSGSLSCTLDKGAMVIGRVLDAEGKPVQGMRVRLAPSEASADGASHEWRSAPEGTFKMGPLKPGAWVADVYPGDFPTDKIASHAAQLAPGPNTLDIVVSSLRSLLIRVTLSDSRFKGPIRVFLQREGAAHSVRFDLAEPAPVREHTARGLPPGRYFAHAWCEQYASPAVPVEIAETEAQVTLPVRQPDCLRVTSVAEGSNAALNGLKDDDLILEYNRQGVSSMAELARLTKASEEQSSVPVSVLRGGKQIEVTVNGGLLGVTAMIACR